MKLEATKTSARLAEIQSRFFWVQHIKHWLFIIQFSVHWVSCLQLGLLLPLNQMLVLILASPVGGSPGSRRGCFSVLFWSMLLASQSFNRLYINLADESQKCTYHSGYRPSMNVNSLKKCESVTFQLKRLKVSAHFCGMYSMWLYNFLNWWYHWWPIKKTIVLTVISVCNILNIEYETKYLA